MCTRVLIAGLIVSLTLIEAVRPDLIVAIEKRTELEPILRAHPTYRTSRIRPSRKARPRGPRERGGGARHPGGGPRGFLGADTLRDQVHTEEGKDREEDRGQGRDTRRAGHV